MNANQKELFIKNMTENLPTLRKSLIFLRKNYLKNRCKPQYHSWNREQKENHVMEYVPFSAAYFY